MANRGEPTPPVAVAADAPTAIDAAAVPLPAGFVGHLRGVCPVVSTEAAELTEHGRDWWPVTVGWAVRDGRVPARAGVVARPRCTAEVAAVLRLCSSERVPVTPMAGRSGVCGGALAVHGGVALDLTGLAGVVGVDDESLTVDVRAGTFGDVLEDELRGEHGLTLGHWPQSIALSTVGGWLACRSAGQYSTRYGKIEDMVVGLEVVLADGTVVRTGGRAPREAVGPDLTQLFVGSEGTLGVITEARLRVHPVPLGEGRAAYGFASFASGLDACRRILRRGATPAVLRLYDEHESARGFGTAATHVLLVLDEADPRIAEAAMAVVADECTAAGARELAPGLVSRWLDHRNDVSGLEAAVRAGLVVDTIEVAAPWSALASVHEQVTAAVLAVPGAIACTCHQSHAYVDGACLYFTIAGTASADGFYEAAWDGATRACLAGGGALSHHHGVGLNRARYVREALGDGAFGVLVAMKAALDPAGVLNPGKLGLPDPFGGVRWP